MEGVLCEIKVGHRFRNLNLWWASFDFIETNSTVEYFKKQKEIIDLFTMKYNTKIKQS